MDGNRTRRTRITRPNRFEGGGAHQVLVHLRGGAVRIRRPRRFILISSNRVYDSGQLDLELPLDGEEVASAGV